MMNDNPLGRREEKRRYWLMFHYKAELVEVEKIV